VWYDQESGPNKTAANVTQISSRSKRRDTSNDDTWYIVQYNTSLELLPNKTVHYAVSCNGNSMGKFEVLYKYWDPYSTLTISTDKWTMVSVGSLGLYNTTETTLQTIKTWAQNLDNVLWTIPGGLVDDVPRTGGRSGHENVTEAESLERWRAWVQLAQNVTCCVPVAAAPSELDLLPHKPDNHLESHFRWFMELPFMSQQSQVLWYSFDHRNLHVISVCTYCDLSEESPQHNWLEEDLKAVSETNKTHWVMVMGHDPVYETSRSLHPQVLTDARIQLDKLLAKYRIDFAVWSHERWYERTKPLKNFVVTEDSESNQLDSVNGTIHYTCGTGGTPLHQYNMEKFNHTARFLASHYGTCAFTRIADDQYESMFVFTRGYDVMIEDLVTITKDLPQRKPTKLESHFSRFMKVFGIVILIGVVIMVLITILIKAVQKHDPSFITNKIRNIRYRKEAAQLGGSSENLEVQEVEMDATDLPSGKEDKVMLLDEMADTEFQVSTAARMYGVTM